MSDNVNDNTSVIVAGVNSEPFVDKIEKEREFLNAKRDEINKIIDILGDEVIQSAKKDDKKFSNYRDRSRKGPSASETMEKIKAYVELQKVSVGIGKDMMLSHEKEFKMKLEGVRLAHTINKNNDIGESSNNNISPTKIKKILKEVKANK